jgi:hypothetical protein
MKLHILHCLICSLLLVFFLLLFLFKGVLSGAEPPLRIVKHVLNRTKGNPLYTIETTEGLLASEVLVVVLGECQITSSLDTNNLHLSVPLPGEDSSTLFTQ